MKLSAPIYALKREAKALSRQENIPLHAALDRIAVREGFSAWSLLATKAASKLGPEDLFASLEPGDMLLLGARPGQGKTMMSPANRCRSDEDRPPRHVLHAGLHAAGSGGPLSPHR